MEMHQAKRVEIIIEEPLERRLTEALESAEVTGYTVLPVLGGCKSRLAPAGSQFNLLPIRKTNPPPHGPVFCFHINNLPIFRRVIKILGNFAVVTPLKITKFSNIISK